MAGRAATTNVFPGDYALAVGAAPMPAPKGWTWCALESVARLESGHTPSRNFPEYWDGGIQWIGIPDAREHHGGTIFNTRQTITELGIENSAARLLPKGTVCLSRTASVGYVVEMGREMATSQDFVNFICGPSLRPDFLKYLFIAEKEALLRFGKGTTHTTIYYPEVKAFHVCLPPVPEQRRIVAKLETLQDRSRRAREALDSVPPLLEKLRQSILAAAFRGDLTKDWRAKHPNVEPAHKLLERIRTERRKKWEEAELAKLIAKGKPPKDGRWKDRYEEPKPLDASGLPELPKGWCWASADEVLTSLRNGIGAKPDRDRGLRILRISAVRPLRVDVDDVRYLPHSQEYESYALSNGDLLLTRYNGNPSLVGVAGMVRDLRERTVYPDKLIRALPNKLVVSAEYIALAFNTGVTRNHIASKAKSAAGQVGVSGVDIKGAPIPIPPLGEQLAIVSAVDAGLGPPDVTKTTTLELLRLLVDLDRQVLAKAFRGQLVPQDPNDEPIALHLQTSSADAPGPKAKRPHGPPKPKRAAKRRRLSSA